MKKIVLAVLFGYVSVAASADIEKLGSWITKSEVNKMTDQTDFVAMNISPDSYNRDGLARETTLAFRCSNNQTDAFLSFHDFMGSDDPRITLRLDGGKPTQKIWDGAESGKSAFSPQSVQFIKELSKHKKAIFGFEPYGTTMRVVEFDLSGIDKVAEKMSTVCKWK